MAVQTDTKRQQASGEHEQASAEPAAESVTRFQANGPVPAVADVQAPQPSASELAFEPGPGVKALEALLAKGPPDPKQIVDLLDAHRDESPAMFAHLETALGSGFTAHVRDAMGLRASISRKEVVAGDPAGEGGFFVASAKEQGARWRTADGSFAGTANNKGLDATYKVDSDDALHAKADTKGNGTLGWEHDGKTMGELYRTDKELGLRKSWEVDGGTLTAGARHRTVDKSASDEAFATYATKDGKLTATGAAGVRDGAPSGLLGATYKASDRDTLTGSVSHDAAGTQLSMSESHKLDGGATITGTGTLAHSDKGTTGSLGGTYHDASTNIDGSVTRGLDQTALHLGAREQLNPNLSVSGSLDHVQRDAGGGQTTLHLGERYRSGNIVQSADLEAGRGERNYLNGTTGLDIGLGKGVYGGAFGGFRSEEGHQTGAQLGASLTFTPQEKAALTLAGILDETGALETRLQVDVFKSKISGVGDIADHKKDALVSLFVSYSTGSNRHMLDQRFGAPTVSTNPDPHVTAGIKIKF